MGGAALSNDSMRSKPTGNLYESIERSELVSIFVKTPVSGKCKFIILSYTSSYTSVLLSYTVLTHLPVMSPLTS